MAMVYSGKNKEKGFTLTELLVVMLISSILMATVTMTFISQQKAYDAQEQIAGMVQTTRAAMDLMSREIRLAGYDSLGITSGANCAGGSPGFPSIVTFTNTTLRFTYDFRGNGGPTTAPDGDCADPDEDINYSFSANQILRNGVVLAENIQSFTFEYFRSDGVTAPTLATDIREVRITITGKTAKRDPNFPSNGGYRTYTLNSFITPPNLAY